MKLLFFTFSLLFFFYLSLPSPDFPEPPSDALQSDEPADTETPLRQAYFTNYTREEVMQHYKNEFKGGFRLNYPPEEARTIIRDQTRSTFLEEIVHPFRESVFVNGFEPKDAKDAIEIKGVAWRQKITVRHVPSNIWVRLVLAISTIFAMLIVFREYLMFLRKKRI